MNAYIDRNLNGRVETIRAQAAEALDTIMRQNAAAHRLASGATLVMFQDGLTELFQREFLAAQQFVFNLTGDHGEDLTNRLLIFGQDVVGALLAVDAERVGRLGFQGDVIPAHKNRLSRDLTQRRLWMAEDFQHGMIGNEGLKKEPIVSIHQSNSPGAVQQVGIGDNFSMQAFNENHRELVAAIERALASKEFAEADPDKKQVFVDTVDVLKEEAAKEKPDCRKASSVGRAGHPVGPGNWNEGSCFGDCVLAAQDIRIAGRAVYLVA